MAGILFFEKSKIDLSLSTTVTITITDATATDTGSDNVDNLRNRKNTDGWATTGSNDAANTQVDIDMGEAHDITDIFLLRNNFDSYTIQYYNGSSYTDFSTAINESGNTEQDQRHSFTSVNCRLIRMIITGTMTADDDKFLSQFVVTNEIGQFTTGFKIDKATASKNRITTESLSGKVWVKRNIGAFSCTLSKNNVINTTDLTIVESLFDYYYGFLVWLCGGSTTQFRTQRIGYRRRDLFLMNVTNEYTPQWDGGFYEHGTNIKIKLVESL